MKFGQFFGKLSESGVWVVGLTSASILSLMMGIAEPDREIVRALWETLLILGFGVISSVVLPLKSGKLLSLVMKVFVSQLLIVAFMMGLERGLFSLAWFGDFSIVLVGSPIALLASFLVGKVGSRKPALNS